MNDVTVSPSATYAWEGTLRNGRKVSGETRGHSPAVIKAQLRRQGITPVRVHVRSSLLCGLGNPITPTDIALFTRQLATLLKAGIPLLQAFDMIGEGFDSRAMRTMVQGLKQEIAAGNSLTAALSKQPQCFNPLYCSLIAAGEQAGTLETLLERVATHLEKSQRLKARIKKAMTYPLVVVLVAMLVSSILLIHVVPQFESLFAGIDTPLPRFTLLVIGLSEFMQGAWWMLLLSVIASAWGIRRAYRRHNGLRLWLDTGLLKLPLAGTLLKKTAVARYARTLATTFAAGVPLAQALDSVAAAAGNERFTQAITRMRQDVAIGMQLNRTMTASGLFPGMAIQMTAIGEESGALDSMLEKVADHYETDVDNLVDNLSSLMEPLIMVVLGSIVGALVIAMYLPIFQLGTAF